MMSHSAGLWRLVRGRLMPVLAVLVLAVPLATGEDAAERSERVLADIKYLASDELEGRGVGTKGLDRAAEYIRDEFQKAGLKSILPDGGYFQAFEMRSGGELDKQNSLVVRGPGDKTVTLVLGHDFVPLGFSASAKFEGPLVFAGYGITAPEFSYDDYAGLDVKDKVVLVMRHQPGEIDKKDPFSPHAGNADTHRARFDQKATLAAQHGAKAVLFVSAPHVLGTSADSLIGLGSDGSNAAKLPLAQVSVNAASSFLKTAIGQDLAELDAAIEKETKPQSRSLDGWTCAGTTSLRPGRAPVKNVMAVLEGSGDKADETIVIGAHYDHLGRGGFGSLAFGSRDIHNGADDNASGTAGLLELARRLAARDKPLARRVLFVAFTGEESGLIGSRHYVDYPPVPLAQTVAMLNMDMIGRLRKDKLIIYGTGTATEFKPLLDSVNAKFQFQIAPVSTGEGPSDQATFYRRSIPVLHFFTDTHADYHKPSDDWDKVSVEGTLRVIDMIEELTVALAGAESRPTFAKTNDPTPVGGLSGDAAYFGSRPAYGQEIDGALLDGVAPGGPAEAAGIRGGDIIVQMGDLPVHGVEDLFKALTTYKPGEVVRVTVIRGTLRITYPATLAKKPARSQ